MAGLKRIFPIWDVKHGPAKTFVDQIPKSAKGFIRLGNDVRVRRLNHTRGNADTYNAGKRTAEHIVLIDDARCFLGQDGYPTIEKLKDYVLSRQPDWTFEKKIL